MVLNQERFGLSINTQLLQLKSAIGTQWLEGRYEGKYLTMHWTAPTTKNYSAQNVVILRLRNSAINILELCSGIQLSFLEIVSSLWVSLLSFVRWDQSSAQSRDSFPQHQNKTPLCTLPNAPILAGWKSALFPALCEFRAPFLLSMWYGSLPGIKWPPHTCSWTYIEFVPPLLHPQHPAYLLRMS